MAKIKQSHTVPAESLIKSSKDLIKENEKRCSVKKLRL